MLKLRKNKFILGITGGIGCGKSTVALMFKNKDCLLIDADRLAHELVAYNPSVYREIVKTFGAKILDENNAIDRKKLGKIVFAHPAALAKLNCILHPKLIRQIKDLIRGTRKKNIVLDAPLIVEAGLTKLVDKLIVVVAQKKQQLLRSKKSLGLSQTQAAERVKSQISQKAKSRFADFIIDNSGGLSKTAKQVSKIRRQLWKS